MVTRRTAAPGPIDNTPLLGMWRRYDILTKPVSLVNDSWLRNPMRQTWITRAKCGVMWITTQITSLCQNVCGTSW